MQKIRSMSEIILCRSDQISAFIAQKRVPKATHIYEEIVWQIGDYKSEIPAETIVLFCQKVAQAHTKHGSSYGPALKVIDWGIATLKSWSSANAEVEQLKAQRKQIELERSQRAKAMQVKPKPPSKKRELPKPKPYENRALEQRLKVAQDRHSEMLLSKPHNLPDSLSAESHFPQMDVDFDPERRALSDRYENGWR